MSGNKDSRQTLPSLSSSLGQFPGSFSEVPHRQQTSQLPAITSFIDKEPIMHPRESSRLYDRHEFFAMPLSSLTTRTIQPAPEHDFTDFSRRTNSFEMMRKESVPSLRPQPFSRADQDLDSQYVSHIPKQQLQFPSSYGGGMGSDFGGQFHLSHQGHIPQHMHQHPSRIHHPTSPPPAPTPQPSHRTASLDTPTPATGLVSMGIPMAQEDDESTKNPGELRHALDFITKIKERFDHDMDRYKSFLKILHYYRQKRLTIKDVYSEVMTLFEGHADLLEEFRHFLPDPKPEEAEQQYAQGVKSEEEDINHEPIGPETRHSKSFASVPRRPEPPPPRSLIVDGTDGNDLFSRTKKKLKGGMSWIALVKCIHLFNISLLSRFELIIMLRDILSRHPDLEQEFKQLLAVEDAVWEQSEEEESASSADEDLRSATPAPAHDEQPTVASGMDFSESRKCGPSYRSIPPNYQLPTCSSRTEKISAVLNDEWVSVPLGNENASSFKNSRKNQYEDILFRCEDDRFEMDLAIATCSACITFLERIQKKLDGLETEERLQFRLSKLPPLHHRTIRKMYGPNKGSDVVTLLCDNPSAAIPVVLPRLKEISENLKTAKAEAENWLRDLCARNHLKSLDHRSFYFKQADRKFISARGITNEIKEIVESADGQVEDCCIRIAMSDESIHHDIMSLTWTCARNTLSATDAVHLEFFWIVVVQTVLRQQLDLHKLDHHLIPHPSSPTSPSPPIGGDESVSIDTSSLLSLSSSCVPDREPVFVGGNLYYMFFRLYGVLYERLSKAKKLSESNKEVWSESCSYQKFLGLVHQLLNGTLENSQYEDQCRVLMGPEAYELFTIDKVLSQMARQPPAAQCNALHALLIGHFSWFMTDKSASDDVYERLCYQLAIDEDCYRIEFNSSNKQLVLRRLDSALLEEANEISEMEQYSHFISDAKFKLPLSLWESRRIFLIRNARKAKTWRNQTPPVVKSGLLCKISHRNSKIVFVHNTTDVFVRRKRCISPSPNETDPQRDDVNMQTESPEKKLKVCDDGALVQ
eukprot:c8449_g1_i3.p1 GENE.c8449_g1_i3~~c8449_g1_i3.p1  ORF type:complete len:1038 (-),score=162.62 c8449_g1_i3:16-3129(-)